MIPSMMTRCKETFFISLNFWRLSSPCTLKHSRSLLLWLFCLIVLPSNSVFCKSTYEGRTYLDHNELSNFWGMRWGWIKLNEKIQLRSQWTSVTYEKHKRTLSLNGYQIALGFPIFEKNGLLYLSELDQKNTLLPILAPHQISVPPKLYSIVLDPGHGGKDTGAISPHGGTYEKTITLKVAKILQQKLQDFGYAVTLTRNNDQYLSLEKRPQIANINNADLFISIHANAANNARVQGVETFVFTPWKMPSTGRNLHRSDSFKQSGNANQLCNTLVGFYLQKELVNTSHSPDRGLKHARFAVLKYAKVPAALVELGFLTNATEAKKLSNHSYQNNLADGLLKGILNYQKTLNRIRNR